MTRTLNVIGLISMVIILCAVTMIDAQATFKATFTITHTERTTAKLTGLISYKSSASKFRLDYTTSQVEWYDATTDKRTRKCGAECKEIPYPENAPDFFVKSGDVAGSAIILDSRNCKIYNRPQSSSEPLQWVAMDGSNNICGALFTNGIQFTFSSVNPNATVTDTELDPESLCQTATVQCNSQLDIYFIGDESGSVLQAGYDSEISFMKQMLDLLDVRTGFVHVGLSFFSDDASLVQELTGDKNTLVTALNSHVYRQGKTCLSCGIDLASLNFGTGASRSGVPKVYVVTTDGKNNYPEPQTVADQRLDAAANKSKGIVSANGGAIVAIGVGTDTNATELAKVVTKDKYVLQVTGFDALKGITNDVLASTCDDSDYICGNCPLGFCLCGACLGCAGGCDSTDQISSSPGPDSLSAGAIAGIVIASVAVVAAAVGGIIWYLKREKQPEVAPEERKTVDIEDRSERYSKLVRKFSVNDDKKGKVTKPED